MLILGIETSCDETALALIEVDNGDGKMRCRVVQSLVHSQAELHSAYGGVYPTLAKREHGKNLVPLMHKLILEAGDALRTFKTDKKPITDPEFDSVMKMFEKEIAPQNPELYQSFKDAKFLKNPLHIDRIAVTEGPGLEPALWVGINFARMLGALWNIPIIPVNHMEGHVVGSLLDENILNGSWTDLKPVQFPAIAFLISGGHTELVEVTNQSDDSRPNLSYKILGKTKDDAVGEAFDKSARLLGLPYPGGPHISMLAEKARQEMIIPKVKLPRPMQKSGDLDFSFSGLKTAVLYAVRDNCDKDGKVSEEFKKGLSLEFENAISETLDYKLRRAIDESGAKSIIIGGGVSANKMLRETFTKTAKEYSLQIYLPTPHVSGDNALMIALSGALMRNVETRNLKADGTKKLS